MSPRPSGRRWLRDKDDATDGAKRVALDWKLLALFEAAVVLFIVMNIVRDWIYPPKQWAWTETFWGQNTEFQEHLPAMQRWRAEWDRSRPEGPSGPRP